MANATLTAITRQVAIQREIVIARLMPDTCNIVPTEGTVPDITGEGVYTDTPATARVWRSLTAIPCRFDLSRAFRPAAHRQQTAVVDEFNLELPFDVIIDENDHIVINSQRFEIMRLKNISNWDVTIEALIMFVSSTRA